MRPIPENYSVNVFLNCPFDQEYETFFNAIVFAVYKCGFVLRCAKEFNDSGDIRIKNIIKLIKECKYGIHDLSRVDARFNMPLELGIFIGCNEFGSAIHKAKQYLVLESEKYRFKKFISDISGQDILSHDNDVNFVIKHVRNWLSDKVEKSLPSAKRISKDYEDFLIALPVLCDASDWDKDDLTFKEYVSLVISWIATDEPEI